MFKSTKNFGLLRRFWLWLSGYETISLEIKYKVGKLNDKDRDDFNFRIKLIENKLNEVIKLADELFTRSDDVV